MQSSDDPSHVAENDRLRSLHMRELVHDAAPMEAPSGAADIPRIIIQFWHDSTAIPPDVCECLDSWEPLTEQGFRRILFDDNAARRFIAKRLGGTYVAALDRCRHPAMRCDYFRLCYIFTEGGFYVDADDVYQGGDCQSMFLDDRMKVQPLCYDILSGTMVQPELFVRNRAHSSDWIFYINNNPLIAPAAHPVVRLALARSTRILLTSKGQPLNIQSTTGPGNLTASLVRHSIALKRGHKDRDFALLNNWEAMSISRWPLSYRDDDRNWRLWNPIA